MSKSQIVQSGSEKFRENSADSVTFHNGSHTAILPDTVTISRSLPTPRKGNMGTTKISLNCRKAFVIHEGTANEKTVLGIVKVETSVPVGIDPNELFDFVYAALYGFSSYRGDMTANGRRESVIQLAVNGKLPDGFGDPTASVGLSKDDTAIL